MNKFTIFGSHGFVGSEIARQLEEVGETVVRVGRDSWPVVGSELGQVIFCIGMTADFRKRLVETFEIQAIRLHDALTRYQFDSFLYLSSARVYDRASATQEEAPLLVRPSSVDHVYNISKIAGESLCFVYDNPRIRVARLSNVYGLEDKSNLFLTSVVRDALAGGEIVIHQDATSSKDYVAVEDAAAILIAIARGGRERIYNVACGRNFSHQQIADVLEQNGAHVRFDPNAPVVIFPQIDTSRVTCEFGRKVIDPAIRIPEIINKLRANNKV